MVLEPQFGVKPRSSQHHCNKAVSGKADMRMTFNQGKACGADIPTSRTSVIALVAGVRVWTPGRANLPACYWTLPVVAMTHGAYRPIPCFGSPVSCSLPDDYLQWFRAGTASKNTVNIIVFFVLTLQNTVGTSILACSMQKTSQIAVCC